MTKTFRRDFVPSSGLTQCLQYQKPLLQSNQNLSHYEVKTTTTLG